MEITKREMQAVEQTVIVEKNAEVKVLGELELVLVGGGSGDISLG
jgi:hypothetical protein